MYYLYFFQIPGNYIDSVSEKSLDARFIWHVFDEKKVLPPDGPSPNVFSDSWMKAPLYYLCIENCVPGYGTKLPKNDLYMILWLLVSVWESETSECSSH
jgi:hypothetical protein